MSSIHKLAKTLAKLYPSIELARPIVVRAGLDPTLITFNDQAYGNWFNILEEADKTGLTSRVIECAVEDYPNSKVLLKVRVKSLQEESQTKNENTKPVRRQLNKYIHTTILALATTILGVYFRCEIGIKIWCENPNICFEPGEYYCTYYEEKNNKKTKDGQLQPVDLDYLPAFSELTEGMILRPLSKVNLQQSASIDSKIEKVVQVGQCLELIEPTLSKQKLRDADSGGWLKVRFSTQCDVTSNTGLRDRQYKLADELYDEEKFQESVDVLHTLLREFPQHARSWKQLSKAYIELGDNKNALRAARQAVNLGPNDSKNHEVLGISLEESGLSELAIASFMEARSLDNYSTWYLPHMVDAYRHNGDLQKALEIADFAVNSLSLKNDSKRHISWVYTTRGRVLYEINKPEQALEDLKRAAEIKPESNYIQDLIEQSERKIALKAMQGQ